MNDSQYEVEPEHFDNAVRLLKQHVRDFDIEPLITTLIAIKDNPGDATLIDELKENFDSLGIGQGAVLTYAPFVSVLIAENPFISEQDQ